jgi:hypothetical protein
MMQTADLGYRRDGIFSRDTGFIALACWTVSRKQYALEA